MSKINLDKVRQAMDKHDHLRERMIRKARDLIQHSKTAIGAVLRDELPQADKILESMAVELEELKKTAHGNGRLIHEGIFKVGVQEYVEALSLATFVKSGKLIPYSEAYVDPENYLLGLCDLSGELVRKAINSAIKEDFPMVIRIRKFLEDLYTELSKFDFRNGELRRKYDGIKYDVKKLDDVVFQLKMKERI